MCEYATDGEGIGDASEQGAVAVAVWAAQDVLVKYAREQFGPAICGGAGVVFGGKLGWLRGGGGLVGSQVQQLGLPMGAQAICIGGLIGRYNEAATPMNSVGIFDSNGRWTSFDNEGSFFVPFMGYVPGYSIPEQLPNALGPLMVGQSWGFQLWHRETGGGSATSNGVLLNW